MTLETRSVSVRMFMEKIIENGSLTKVTLVKNSVSPDLSDSMFISTGREEKSYIKPKLHQKWVRKFLDFLDGKNQDDIFEINDEKYQDIRITFSLSGKVLSHSDTSFNSSVFNIFIILPYTKFLVNTLTLGQAQF